MCFPGTSCSASGPLAELVSFTTDDGVQLHGLLYHSQSDSGSVVIHVSGGPGSFYGTQDMAPLAEKLTENGLSLLSINMRTAGANGMFYANFEDYRRDVGGAVEFSKNHGMRNIFLLGHSLGSTRVVYYVYRASDQNVKGIILSGAVTSPYQALVEKWNAQQKEAFDEFLAEQRNLIKAGRGKSLSSYPVDAGIELIHSASTWVDIFGHPEESNASTVKFADEITVPVLLIHGTDDPIAPPTNAHEIRDAMVNSPAAELIIVKGADHVFTQHAEQYSKIVSNWLQKQLRHASD